MEAVTVIGARPQFIKAAVLSTALRSVCREIIIHTGQHYDDEMSDIFFRQLQLPAPKYNLGVGSGKQGKQTARMLEGIESVLETEQPNFVLVYGDTNSTLAGSLAAAKLHIPIVHVESGLRSFNRTMPEEINRIVTDQLSTMLFCPTVDSVSNLKREGIHRHVHLVGDIMYDSVLAYQPLANQQSKKLLSHWGLQPKDYALATIHRQENTDNPDKLRGILEGLGKLTTTVLLPMHPRTAKAIEQAQLQKLLQSSAIRVCPPLSYLDMLSLTSQAELVFTDSGGVQKEAYMLQVPCITLREETEWVETVQTGWNQLAGADAERIVHTFRSLQRPADSPAIFGDGQAAVHIRRHIEAYFNNRS